MDNQNQQSAPDATNSPAASELIRSTGSRHVCPGCGCDDTEEIEGAWNDWCNNGETHFYFENTRIAMNEAKNERNELASPTGSPRRVQRKRTKGWKMPPNTVSVCRPGKWGNPFKVGERISDMNPSVVQNRAEAVACFRVNLLIGRLDFTVKDVITALAGKNLACFCALDQPCHADVLLSEANVELSHKDRSCE